jgi:hypothetical protein
MAVSSVLSLLSRSSHGTPQIRCAPPTAVRGVRISTIEFDSVNAQLKSRQTGSLLRVRYRIIKHAGAVPAHDRAMARLSCRSVLIRKTKSRRSERGQQPRAASSRASPRRADQCVVQPLSMRSQRTSAKGPRGLGDGAGDPAWCRLARSGRRTRTPDPSLCRCVPAALRNARSPAERLPRTCNVALHADGINMKSSARLLRAHTRFAGAITCLRWTGPAVWEWFACAEQSVATDNPPRVVPVIHEKVGAR